MPKVKVRLGNIVVDTILDTRAEVNIITKGLADLAGLTVRTNIRIEIKAVSGRLSKFAGVCKDIEVNIGSIVNLQTILVIPNLAYYKLILGQPFVYNIQVCLYFNKERYQYIKFYNKDCLKVGTIYISKLQGKAVRNARIDRKEEGISENK
jgi:hypothetical protein